MFRAAMCPSSGELLYSCDSWFMSIYVDDRPVCRSICSFISDSHLHSDINKCVALINNNSPDNGHLAARNMYRIQVNIHEKLCVKLVVYRGVYLSLPFLLCSALESRIYLSIYIYIYIYIYIGISRIGTYIDTWFQCRYIYTYIHIHM